MNQTYPDKLPACPGQVVAFMCTTETGALGWLEKGILYLLSFPDTLSASGSQFFFELSGINGSTYISTATVTSISSADNNKPIGCFDGNTIVSQTILVAGRYE